MEPSHTIKKFLDGPRISQLCYYLEMLHHRGLAIGHHTTLLMSAYVKLNAVQKLIEFVDNEESSLSRNDFDIESTIKVNIPIHNCPLAICQELEC